MNAAATSAAEPVLYGIVNCDTVKRSRAWFAERGIGVQFHDLRKSGVPADRLDAWIAAVGWEKLVNRQGLTWKKLDAPVRERVVDAASARALMLASPSVIKRPVVEAPGGAVSVGYAPDEWARRLT